MHPSAISQNPVRNDSAGEDNPATSGQPRMASGREDSGEAVGDPADAK